MANESNTLPSVEENSTAFLNLILSNKDFNNVIKDPTVSRDVLVNIINKITESFKLEILFKNFLNFLILKRRFFHVEQIIKSFN